MTQPVRSPRGRIIVVLLILTAVAFLTLDLRGFGPLEDARRTALRFFAPARSAVTAVVSPVGDAWQGVTDYDDLAAENATLRARIEELEALEIQEESAARSLQAFLTDASIDYAPDLPTTAARVSAGRTSNFDRTIEIDKGTADGVREGMTVASGSGLVGRIERAATHHSIVVLLTDPRFDVGVRLVSTGDLGLASGAGVGQPLVVEVGEGGADALLPDTILETSGLVDAAYPAGVPVARITVRPEGEPVAEAVPLANLDRLEFVAVILWEADQ
ncbi:MAG: rod shape-determining protein MreC [Actinomycetia bacterium]|nr:rod shape-determining protein MreC [Actinomycetes bacterium]